MPLALVLLLAAAGILDAGAVRMNRTRRHVPVTVASPVDDEEDCQNVHAEEEWEEEEEEETDFTEEEQAAFAEGEAAVLEAEQFEDKEEVDLQDEINDMPYTWFMDKSAALKTVKAKIVRSRPVQWVHVHKSGGTFMCLMAKVAGEKVVAPSRNCNWFKFDSYVYGTGHPEKRVSCATRKKFFKKAKSGWGQIEREIFPSEFCFDDLDYGIMIREPLARMVSMLNFRPSATASGVLKDVQQRVTTQQHDSAKTQLSLWKHFDNFLLRILVPGAMNDAAGTIGASHLAVAKAVLKNFTYVQRLEDMPETAEALFKDLGWPKTMKNLVGTKKNAHKGAEEHFSHEGTAWLKELNAPEIELYEWAARRQAGLKDL